jgi:hypothetical protein
MEEKIDSKKYIIVKGARENNLKNLDVTIPKDTLTVFTGFQAVANPPWLLTRSTPKGKAATSNP